MGKVLSQLELLFRRYFKVDRSEGLLGPPPLVLGNSEKPSLGRVNIAYWIERVSTMFGFI